MGRAARGMFWMRVASAGILLCRCVHRRIRRSVEFTGYALRLLLHACAEKGSVAFLACGLFFASGILWSASLLALDSQFNGEIGARCQPYARSFFFSMPALAPFRCLMIVRSAK